MKDEGGGVGDAFLLPPLQIGGNLRNLRTTALPMTPPPDSPDPCVQAWTHREEILYPALFGRQRRGVFAVQPEMFTGTFGQADFHPNWVRCGVFEFAPSDRRASWLYVTSGMSNAWDAGTPDPAGPSGLGGEFVLETLGQSPWAIPRLLYVMAYQLLVCAGRYPDRQPLQDYDQLPLHTTIGTEPTALTWLMLAPPTGFPRRHETRTGWFDFSEVVGISEVEAAAARIHGGPLLVKGLQQEGFFPVTMPERKSII